MNGLDLFSGIGGISYALREYVTPIAYCEKESYCQSVLISRMSTGDLPIAPIWDDICTFKGKEFEGKIDILYGGFPCQDISVAGLGKGLEGKRSGLFFEIVRLSEEIKPKFIFLENVPAITSRGGLRVVKELATMGYDCRWCIISAKDVGARHLRKRFFLLAHAKHDGQFTCENRRSFRELPLSRKAENQQEKNSGETQRASCLSEHVAHSSSESADGHTFGKEKENSLLGIRGNDGNSDSQSSFKTDQKSESDKRKWESRRGFTRQCGPYESRKHWQETVDTVCRSSDVLPFHVDRLRALGNSIVPPQVKKAFEILMGIK
jgi:DNA (cytosine-5)-methyltransferase 1